MAAGPCIPVDDVPRGQGLGGEGGEEPLDLRDGQRDQPGLGRGRLTGRDRGRGLGVGPAAQQRGGDGAYRQGGHDEHHVAQDRGVEPDLGLV